MTNGKAVYISRRCFSFSSVISCNAAIAPVSRRSRRSGLGSAADPILVGTSAELLLAPNDTSSSVETASLGRFLWDLPPALTLVVSAAVLVLIVQSESRVELLHPAMHAAARRTPLVRAKSDRRRGSTGSSRSARGAVQPCTARLGKLVERPEHSPGDGERQHALPTAVMPSPSSIYNKASSRSAIFGTRNWKMTTSQLWDRRKTCMQSRIICPRRPERSGPPRHAYTVMYELTDWFRTAFKASVVRHVREIQDAKSLSIVHTHCFRFFNANDWHVFTERKAYQPVWGG